jgi:hypothetical protein
MVWVRFPDLPKTKRRKREKDTRLGEYLQRNFFCLRSITKTNLVLCECIYIYIREKDMRLGEYLQEKKFWLMFAWDQTGEFFFAWGQQQMTEARKKDSLSFFSRFFLFFFLGKQIFKLQNYDKFSFFGSDGRPGLEHLRFSENLRGYQSANIISVGFVNKFGQKSSFNMASVKKLRKTIKKSCWKKKEKRDEMSQKSIRAKQSKCRRG